MCKFELQPLNLQHLHLNGTKVNRIDSFGLYWCFCLLALRIDHFDPPAAQALCPSQLVLDLDNETDQIIDLGEEISPCLPQNKQNEVGAAACLCGLRGQSPQPDAAINQNAVLTL